MKMMTVLGSPRRKGNDVGALVVAAGTDPGVVNPSFKPQAAELAARLTQG